MLALGWSLLLKHSNLIKKIQDGTKPYMKKRLKYSQLKSANVLFTFKNNTFFLHLNEKKKTSIPITK